MLYHPDKNPDLIAQAKFLEIRDLCATLYANVASDEIFHSLQRGVKVLTEQNQLLAYINSYGKMHYAKVMSAFSALSSQNLTLNIIKSRFKEIQERIFFNKKGDAFL